MTSFAPIRGSHPVTPVLLASPVESDCMVMQGLLRDTEYLLVHAPTWGCALNLAGHFVFPVVLYDQLLDAEDWQLAFRRLVSGWRVPSVLLLAPESDRRLRDDVIRAGGFDILVRPFQLPDVRKRLDAARCNFSCAGRSPAS